MACTEIATLENPKVDSEGVKEFLSFLLSSFRAKLALKNSSAQPYSFDYDQFLKNFKWLVQSSNSSAKIYLHLKYVVEQGLLDPLLPYLRTTLKIRKSLADFKPPALIPQELKFSISQSSPPPPPPHGFSPVGKKRLAKEEPHLIIHVCEEGKGIWQDFPCRQNVLVSGMGYFSRVAVKGQSLVDMDISVYCEISIFQWLLDWILPSTNQKEKIKEINALNVVGLVVSAEFLQIPTLTTICLRYIAENIETVTTESPNLACLSDTLVTRLAQYFQNGDIERRIGPKDKSDRITSRLYLQFILLMTCSVEVSLDKGHTTSISSLFQCKTCKQLLTNEIASSVPCANEIRVDCFGFQFSVHIKDGSWSLISYIRDLKRELKSWRRVYWRLWGIANYFLCLTCKLYYPAKFKSTCKFHPSERNSQREEESLEMRIAAQYYRHYGRKPFEFPAQAELDAEEEAAVYSRRHACCSAPFFKFRPITTMQGCRTKNHVPDLSKKFALAKLEILESFEDLIVQEPEPDFLKHLGKLRQHEKGVVEEFLKRSPSMSSSTLEEWSSPERDLDETSSAQVLRTQYGFGREAKDTPRPGVNDLWVWNLDLSTRYNQDMQRELEEKYMLKLAMTLSQRSPL